MKLYIIKFSIFMAYYVLGAFATTDYLRLTSYGNFNPRINSSDCYCPSCNHKLKLTDQIPLFSFLLSRGKCLYCKAPIPRHEFILELCIFAVCSTACIIGKFSVQAFFFTVAFYEAAKLITVILLKPKKTGFIRSLLFSIAVNIPIFMIIFLLFSFNRFISQ